MTGRVARWFPKGLHGYIAGEDGVEYHVRAQDVRGGWLTIGQVVRFDVTRLVNPSMTRSDTPAWTAVHVEALSQELPRHA